MNKIIEYEIRKIQVIIAAFLLGVIVIGILTKWDYNSLSAHTSYSTARMFTFLIYILVIGSVMKIGKHDYKHNSKRIMGMLPIAKYEILTSRLIIVLTLSILGGGIVYATIPLFGFSTGFVDVARNYLISSVILSLVIGSLYFVLLDTIGYKKLFPVSWFTYFLLVVAPSLLRTVSKKTNVIFIKKMIDFSAEKNLLFLLLIIIVAYMLTVYGYYYISYKRIRNAIE